MYLHVYLYNFGSLKEHRLLTSKKGLIFLNDFKWILKNLQMVARNTGSPWRDLTFFISQKEKPGIILRLRVAIYQRWVNYRFACRRQGFIISVWAPGIWYYTRMKDWYYIRIRTKPITNTAWRLTYRSDLAY